MHMSVAPYIEGDRPDANRVRVYDHHCLGLSGAAVMIDGVKREVRNVGRPDGRKHRDWNATILLRLVPIVAKRPPSLECKDISTVALLRRVKLQQRFPTRSEYAFDNDQLNRMPGPRLFKRKEQKLWNRGYVAITNTVPQRVTLTDKGLRFLEQHND